MVVYTDLITLSSKIKISPEPIEEAIKHELEVVSHCMVVGEGRPYLVVLIALQVSRSISESAPDPCHALENVCIMRYRRFVYQPISNEYRNRPGSYVSDFDFKYRSVIGCGQ